MIEDCKRMIEKIENEIAELTRDCEDLDEARRKTDGRAALSETQINMVRTMGRACDLAPNLRIMQHFRDDFMGITRGPKTENVATVISDFLRDLEEERKQRNDRLREKLQILTETKDLLKNLMSDLETGFGGGGSGGGRIV